jgi:mono/diheme cytochrome c family protein
MTLNAIAILTAALFHTNLASILAVIALSGTLQLVGAGEPMPTANLDDYQKSIAPLFAKSCVDCHGPNKSEAGLRVDELDANLLTGADFDRWVEIYDVLSQREMPPDDEPDYHLKDEDRTQIMEWVGNEMQKASQLRNNAGGHSSFRRMANYEYNHALEDLLNLNLQFTAALPPENNSEDGFKNSSKYLQMSVTQLETYRKIAIEALQKATVEGDRPKVVTWQIPMQEAMDKAEALKQKSIDRSNPTFAEEGGSTHVVNKETGKGLSYQWTYYLVLEDEVHEGVWNLKPDETTAAIPPVSSVVAVIPPSQQFHLDLGNSVPDEGILRVRIRVGASERHPGQSANLRLVYGFQTNNEGKMSARVTKRDVEVTASTNEPEFITFDVPLDGLPRNPYRKVHEVGGSPNCTEYLEIHNISYSGKKGEGDHVNLEIDYVEVEAGLYETWPPKSHTAIFFESPNQNDEDTYCREILKRFMTRAWRRPIADEDIAPYHELFSKYRPGFSSFQETMIEVLATVFASPEFLYLVQTESETTSASHTISDIELANRLSFFLWSSIPDTTLLDLAFAGKLKSPDILDSQIERMLADPKSQRFTQHFVQQWLGLEAMDNLVVDQKKFKVYDEAFQENLLGEPLALFDHILRNNRSIMDFLQADYLVINEPLARHYGIPGVSGQEFRKVPLSPKANSPKVISTGFNRGGLLTTAAVLTMTSTGVDSNPLKRGVWLLERMLHDPPPLPPPNVPEVDLTDPRILKMTPKERMADHRNQAACRSCHAKIDPWGLSLENFDAIGRFRTTIDDQPVDAIAVLPNDQPLHGAAGLKSYLMANRQDQFAKAMVHKLSTYALGRPMSFADRGEIDAMAEELKKRGHGLHDLVSIVIHSKLFSQKIKQDADLDQ